MFTDFSLMQLHFQIHTALMDAKTPKSVMDSIALAEKYPSRLEYKNYDLYLSALVILLVWAFVVPSDETFLNAVLQTVIMTLLVILYLLHRLRKKIIPKLSDKALFMLTEFEHELVNLEGSQAGRELRDRISPVISAGEDEKLKLFDIYSVDEGAMVFTALHYTKIDNKQSSTSGKEYRLNYETHGFLVNSNRFNHLAMIGESKFAQFAYAGFKSYPTFEPIGEQFNQHFKIYAESQIEAAKFASPTLVDRLSEFDPSLSIAFFDGQLLISSSLPIISAGGIKRQFSYAQPEDFLKELQEHTLVFEHYQGILDVMRSIK